MGRPVVTSELEYRRAQSRDIAALKRRRPKAPNLRGTAAERDEYYGVPTTDAEKIAMGGARWFDSDLGLWFTYFVDYTIPGAPPGLRRQGGGWGIQDDTMPSGLIDKEGGFAIAAGVPTLVPWRTTDTAYDPFGWYDVATPTRFITAPWSGFWRVNYKIRFSTNTPVTVNIKRNGSNYTRARSSDTGASGAAPTVQSNAPIFVTAGQYLELEVTAVAAGSVASSESFVETTYMGLEAK